MGPPNATSHTGEAALLLKHVKTAAALAAGQADQARTARNVHKAVRPALNAGIEKWIYLSPSVGMSGTEGKSIAQTRQGQRKSKA